MKGFVITLAVVLGIAWAACAHFSGILDAAGSGGSEGSMPASEELMSVQAPKGLRSQMKEYEGYTVSFNRDTHCPNYCAWVLTADEAGGEEPRGSGFWQDTDIRGCATSDDYRNTGFDRGHMAPAGDMKWSPEAMQASFSMANICPQAHSLNAGAWKKLEEKCRQRAMRDGEVVIVCGPVPMEGTDAPLAHLGRSGVAVPARFFKVVLSPKADPPRAIGFIMANGHVEGGMQAAAVSVDSVEALTGYDFFAALPDSLEVLVESRCDFHAFSRVK